MLLIFCGPPGTGKTTVAQALADRLRADANADADDFELLHSDDFSRNTYEQLYERAVESDPETNWILDGTFYRTEYQKRFRALPDAHLVYVTASLEICLERNRVREDSIDEKGVYAMHAKFEEPQSPDLTLDTDELSVAEAVEAVVRYVRTWTKGSGE